MPIIHVQLLAGRSPELKRELIRELTDATERALGSERESIRVLLTEVAAEDWAIGGTPISERRRAEEPAAEEGT